MSEKRDLYREITEGFEAIEQESQGKLNLTRHTTQAPNASTDESTHLATFEELSVLDQASGIDHK